MNTISIEIVPKTVEDFTSAISLAQKYPDITAVNVPDLPRYPDRIWKVLHIATRAYPKTIPHIRAVDVSSNNWEVFLEKLTSTRTTSVLVIRGDIPNTVNAQIYPTTTLQLIERIRNSLPEITIYAGLDPYRSGMKSELAYAKDKIRAGASGLFTQPFFDLRLMQVWAEQLGSTDVFWGITPVTNERSKVGYWEVKNNVIFPHDFHTSIEWNQQFARNVLEWMRECPRSHAYIMPIGVNLEAYLSGIFE